MKYSKGINYQLEADEDVYSGIVGHEIDDDYFSLLVDGLLVVKEGYAWDGASGAIDTDTNLRASLFHDALCQMIGNGQLLLGVIDKANELYREICLADGMSRFRAWLEFKAITFHFRNGVKPQGDREIYVI